MYSDNSIFCKVLGEISKLDIVARMFLHEVIDTLNCCIKVFSFTNVIWKKFQSILKRNAGADLGF